MSDSHGHEAGSEHGDHAHDDHGHEAFDPEPAKDLAPGETPTASWVPLVGAGLFLVGTVVFLVKQTDAAPGSASASASAVATATALQPAVTPPGTGRPIPPADPAKRREFAEEQKKRMLRNAKSAGPLATTTPSARPAPAPSGARP